MSAYLGTPLQGRSGNNQPDGQHALQPLAQTADERRRLETENARQKAQISNQKKIIE